MLSGRVTRDLTKPSFASDQLCMEVWNLWWDSSPARQPRLVFFLSMMFSWAATGKVSTFMELQIHLLMILENISKVLLQFLLYTPCLEGGEADGAEQEAVRLVRAVEGDVCMEEIQLTGTRGTAVTVV